MCHEQVEVLSALNGQHIVRLYGWCPSEISLVYELYSGGNLEVQMQSLSWNRRVAAAHEVTPHPPGAHTHQI